MARFGTQKLYIDGGYVDASTDATFEAINPATGEVLTQVALAGPEDVDEAVYAARLAWESGPWSRLSGAERGELLALLQRNG